MRVFSLPGSTSILCTVIVCVQLSEKGNRDRGPPSINQSQTTGSIQDWETLADVGQHLTFPLDIVATNLRPNLTLWSNAVRTVYFVEVTVPWENGVDEAYESQRLWYAAIVTDAE